MFPLDVLGEPLWQRLTWTLLHFLWQGLAVAAGVATLLYVWPLRRARDRYLVYLSALVAMAACPLVTFMVVEAPESTTPARGEVEMGAPLPPAAEPELELVASEMRIGPAGPAAREGQPPLDHSQTASPAVAPTDLARSDVEDFAMPPVPATWEARLRRSIDAIQPYALMAWIAGVLLLAVRLSLSWMHVRWLAWGRRAIPADLAAKAAGLGRRLRLRFPPRVCVSEKIREAIVVGLWRPLVLLPASWLAQMPPEVLEAVIAHELAHVRRLDLWVNLLQRLMETLLFYHPAVWWLSRRVGLEREMGTDELAVGATRERLVYATALEQLGRMRLGQTALQLGANIGGNKTVLLNRVGNILGTPRSTNRARWWPVALLAMAVPLAVWLASTEIVSPTGNETRAEEGADDTGDTPTLNSEAALSIIDTAGEPIAGARVQFDQHVRVESNGRQKGEYVVVAQAVSNTEGRVEMPSEALLGQGASRLVVRVDAEGYVSRHWSHEAYLSRNSNGEWFIDVTDGVFDKSIVLLKASSIAGRVLGPDGKPLPGAPLSMTTDCDYEDYWRGSGRSPNRAGYAVANHLRAISDQNGEFRFENVPPGELFLYYPWDGPTNAEVSDRRWRDWTNPGEPYPSAPTKGLTWNRSLRLAEGRRVNNVVVDLSKSTCVVEGRVLDADRTPVVGALVATTWDNGHTVPNNDPPVHTDADGRYRITGLPPSMVAVFATLRVNDPDAPRGVRNYRTEVPAQLFTGEIVKANLRFDAKIDTSASDSAAWGKAVDGVQCRLEAAQTTWNLNSTPRLNVFARAQNDNDLLLSNGLLFGCELEVNGKWYEYWDVQSFLGQAYLSARQGEQQGRSLALPLQRKSWRRIDNKQPLELKPGKHQVRFAWAAYRPDYKTSPPKERPPIRLISNRVQIEILSAHKTPKMEPDGGRPAAEESDKPSAASHPPRASITGRVTDAAGKPVAGALLEWGHYQDPPSKRQQTTTDAEGRYHLELAEFGVGFRLGVSAPTMAPMWQVPYADWVHPPEPVRDEDAIPPKRMDFQLEPMHWIAGTVVDQSGKPIEGVRISARTAVEGGYSSFSSPTAPMSIPGEGHYQIETDSTGRFRLEGLPGKQVQLHLAATHRHVNDRNYSVDHEHRIVMSGSGRPGIVRAQVVDARTGKPVEQFNVARRYDPKQREIKSADGRFLWDDVHTEGNNYRFYVYSEDYAPAAVDLQAVSPDSQEETVIKLSPGNPLVATLVDAQSGKPLAGVPVLYAVVEEDDRYFEWSDRDSYIDGHHPLTLVQRAVTGNDGSFWFSEAHEGRKGTLFVITPGYERMVIRPEDRSAPSDSKRLKLGLHREASITGVLVIDGRPEPNVNVSISKSEPRSRLEEFFEAAVTDSEGRYRFGSLGPGTYSLAYEARLSRTTFTSKPFATATLARGEFVPVAIQGKRDVARPADADARQGFLAIERLARLPIPEQAKQLSRLYKDLAPRYMNPIVEGILSAYRDNILDPKKYGAPGGDHTTRWAQQLADAASEMTPEQVADKLEIGLWLNVAARARAIQVFKQHADATAALIEADLSANRKQPVERAAATILALDLRTFTDRLLAMYIEDADLPEGVYRTLLFLRDPQLVRPLLEEVKKNPKFLARCAGLFQGPLYRKPAEPLLLGLLNSPDAEIRYGAVFALYECSDPKLAQPAVELAGEKEGRLRSAAAQLASNLPRASFAAVRDDLLPLLSDKEEPVRFDALRCFAQQKDLAAGPVILKLLKRDQLGEPFKITVMQAMSKLAGSIFNYYMHEWGPDRPGNQRAIEKFEAWLQERRKAGGPHASSDHVAWGEIVNGLQAGLATADSPRVTVDLIDAVGIEERPSFWIGRERLTREALLDRLGELRGKSPALQVAVRHTASTGEKELTALRQSLAGLNIQDVSIGRHDLPHVFAYASGKYDGTIRGRVVDAHPTVPSPKYHVMLWHKSWESMSGENPSLVVGAGEAFEFRNVGPGDYEIRTREWRPNNRVVHFDRSWTPVTTKAVVEDGKVTEVRVVFGEGETGRWSDAYTYGEAADGVIMRVTRAKFTIAPGEKIDLQVDLYNGGKTDREIVMNHENWQLEIDGQWIKESGGASSGRAVYLLKAKQGQHNMGVWVWLGANMMRAIKGLPPGKHTLRVAHLLDGEGPSSEGPPPIRVVSQPVIIEVVAEDEGEGIGAADSPGVEPEDGRAVPPGKTTVRGKVVDDATGKPIARFITQGGQFDPADPAKVVWGFTETRSSAKDGRFSTTVRWPEGWTARIVAAGYLPQPILTQPPSPGQDAIEVVIRLKRGDTVRGRVLDHTGQAVARAGVYLAGRGVIDLAEGPWGEFQGPTVRTDAEGRFEISGLGKDSKAIFVSAPSLYVWRADVPQPGQEAIIRLPEPARLHVRYDVEGGPPAAQVRIEFRTWDMPNWKALVDVVRWVDVKAGDDGFVVDNLPPGVYDVSRVKHTRAGNSGKHMLLDRQLNLTLASGKTTTYDFVRKKGMPIGGDVVGLPEQGVSGVFLYVRDQRASGDPRSRDDWKLPTFDGLALEGNGPFKTERIPPGKYKVVVEAYRQETREEMGQSGWRLPKWIGTAVVDVPESGEPPKVRVMMRSYDAR